jgi:hypothetical protein
MIAFVQNIMLYFHPKKKKKTVRGLKFSSVMFENNIKFLAVFNFCVTRINGRHLMFRNCLYNDMHDLQSVDKNWIRKDKTRQDKEVKTV